MANMTGKTEFLGTFPPKIYIAVDLKSFYASVECQERGLDPLSTNLVVADTSRTEKTICLAVSPSLKAYGISGRARLFEVVQKVKEINRQRLANAPGHAFSGKSHFAPELKADASLELYYIAAPPRMAKYIEYSTEVCERPPRDAGIERGFWPILTDGPRAVTRPLPIILGYFYVA